ncbi:copper resistance system multicopper oxidase [Alphaproteobacteria bacterium]|nr:copper resistance system multicopper oxidase [Alphaproteobacteria bacterium]
MKKNIKIKIMTGALSLLSALLATQAWAKIYDLDIAYKDVNITGNIVKKIAVNGTIPGPTLRFTDGEKVTVNVTNYLDEDTSIHWHGILLPGEMDGVPGLNGFAGIKPGETFTYHFNIRQTGTYWYHSHSKGQEQDGLYGSLVISPKGDNPVQAERDYVILLSDFHDEDASSIMKNLKMSYEYYQYARRTIGDFIESVRKVGFGKAWKNAKMWGEMRMLPTDLADVTGYTFLTNGKTSEQNWTGIFKAGERVRLRFINASAMSFFDVRIPDLKMQVVGSDGQNVEPVPVDEFRIGTAEIYDVIVTPPDDKAYTIIAEPIDRTGFALGTLAPRDGMRGKIPKQREHSLLTMKDMGMKMSGMDHNKMRPTDMQTMMEDMKSGWAKTGSPKGAKTLDCADLRYRGIQDDIRPAEREIVVTLGGNMERYIWTMNGEKYTDSKPINLKYGERVRLKFTNETMMAHPMHLHGMFFQLENGQPLEKMPNKNMVIVKPGDSYSVLLSADEPGEWAFHCHLLYHMMSGMMTKVVVATLDESDVPADAKSKLPMALPVKRKMESMDHSKMDHAMPKLSEDGGHNDAH